MKGLTPKIQDKNIFISVEKDINGNYILYYKKKFYCDVSTIADFLATVIMKQYNNSILRIFDPYHQTLAKEVIWDDQRIPKNKEE